MSLQAIRYKFSVFIDYENSCFQFLYSFFCVNAFTYTNQPPSCFIVVLSVLNMCRPSIIYSRNKTKTGWSLGTFSWTCKTFSKNIEWNKFKFSFINYFGNFHIAGKVDDTTEKSVYLLLFSLFQPYEFPFNCIKNIKYTWYNTIRPNYWVTLDILVQISDVSQLHRFVVGLLRIWDIW